MRGRYIFLFLGILLACGGGGGSSTSSIGSGGGNLMVHLAGGPGDGVQSLNLQIQKVELNGPQGWQTVASPNMAYSITTLVDGNSATLASGGSLAPGTYSALRLTVGPSSTAQLAGGNATALGFVAPVFVFPLRLTVSTSMTDLTLILDPGRSVQPRGGLPVFAPELQVVDRNATGAILGKVTDGAGQALPGVLVTAQCFHALGDPFIIRRALTRSDGSFQLDLLPFGTTCYAVCFPQTATSVFDPIASAPFTPSGGASSATFTALLTAAQIRTDLGSATGTVTAVTNAMQDDEIQLAFTPIPAGAASQLFLIGTSPGILDGGTEKWAFTRLPAGSTYRLQALRRTWAPDGTSTSMRKLSDDYGFLANLNFLYDFLF